MARRISTSLHDAKAYGVRFGAEMPPTPSWSGATSKRLATPASERDSSSSPFASRGVWHSPHDATLRTRYSPRTGSPPSEPPASAPASALLPEDDACLQPPEKTPLATLTWRREGTTSEASRAAK